MGGWFGVGLVYLVVVFVDSDGFVISKLLG